MKVWTWICEKLLTAGNLDKANSEIKKLLIKLKEKEAKKGFTDPVTLALIFAGGLLLGSVFGHGVTTRSIIVNIEKSPNAHVENIKVEVSGTGGVSVPIR